MTKEDLKPLIETNPNQFWLNSVDLANTDSSFFQNGFHDVDTVLAYFKKHPDEASVVNWFLKMNFIVKGEYFIKHTRDVILTDKRLFLWYSDYKKVVALKNIVKYSPGKNGGIDFQYFENGVLNTMTLHNKWLRDSNVNEALAKHQSKPLTSAEMALLSDFKPAIQAKHEMHEVGNYEDYLLPVDVSQKPIVKQELPKIPKLQAGKLLIGTIILGLFIWWMYSIYSQPDCVKMTADGSLKCRCFFKSSSEWNDFKDRTKGLNGDGWESVSVDQDPCSTPEYKNLMKAFPEENK